MVCRTNRNVWETEPHRLTGRGIGVAVLDTGCFPHEDLQNRIAAFRDIVGRKRLPYDDNGHGTHVCGIIGGNGYSSSGACCGLAPECHLIPVKVLDRLGNGYASDVVFDGFGKTGSFTISALSISLSVPFPEKT